MFYKLFLTLLLWSFVGNQSNPEEVMVWNETLKLKWSDFQGTPKDLGDVAALTASGISFEFSIQEKNRQIIGFTTQVSPHFYPKRSWVHKKRSSNHILAHEQLHFDITELHVRKFRKEISQLKVSKHIKSALNLAYKNINQDMALMQSAYDLETNHSRDTLAQSRWRKKVESQLLHFENFKTPH